MAEIKYRPIRHDEDAFLKKARKRRGFKVAYEALAVEYAASNEMLAARARAGLTQEMVASRMGTTKSGAPLNGDLSRQNVYGAKLLRPVEVSGMSKVESI